MEVIIIQEVEKAIADYRAAEAALAKHFGLKPVTKSTVLKKAKNRRKAIATKGKANGRGNGISDAQRTARQLQGVYLGAIRQLSAQKRLRVSNFRAKNGTKAAIAFAKKLA